MAKKIKIDIIYTYDGKTRYVTVESPSVDTTKRSSIMEFAMDYVAKKLPAGSRFMDVVVRK